MRISAIQIAAGLSTRMKGPNKLLQDIGSESLIKHSSRQLTCSEVDEVILVTGRDREAIEHEIEELYVNDSNLILTHNGSFEKGMTTSIQAGINTMGNNDAIMICLSDMPELTSRDYNALMKDFKKRGGIDKIMVPYNGERRGNPVIFGASYFDQIREHKAPNGCSAIVKSNLNRLLLFETSSSHYFFDIDTPETLASYKARVN